jgi:predicted O-methyltransferase YrrM
MAIIDERVEAYLHDLAPTTDAVQAQMERIGVERSFPIVGPLVGRLLRQVAMAIGARDVFEMGSGFGYSTLFFAQAVGEGGRVVHTDTDATLSAEARAHLRRAGLAARVSFEVGNSLELITRYPGAFDIVFIDVEKRDYPAAFDLARVRVRTGGFIIVDNVLWRGRVAGDPAQFDADTRAIDQYNRASASAGEFLTTILPLRDGVALHYKLGDAPRRIRTATVPVVPKPKPPH